MAGRPSNPQLRGCFPKVRDVGLEGIEPSTSPLSGLPAVGASALLNAAIAADASRRSRVGPAMYESTPLPVTAWRREPGHSTPAMPPGATPDPRSIERRHPIQPADERCGRPSGSAGWRPTDAAHSRLSRHAACWQRATRRLCGGCPRPALRRCLPRRGGSSGHARSGMLAPTRRSPVFVVQRSFASRRRHPMALTRPPVRTGARSPVASVGRGELQDHVGEGFWVESEAEMPLSGQAPELRVR
jgi:hypothetical protein